MNKNFEIKLVFGFGHKNWIVEISAKIIKKIDFFDISIQNYSAYAECISAYPNFPNK